MLVFPKTVDIKWWTCTQNSRPLARASLRQGNYWTDVNQEPCFKVLDKITETWYCFRYWNCHFSLQLLFIAFFFPADIVILLLVQTGSTQREPTKEQWNCPHYQLYCCQESTYQPKSVSSNQPVNSRRGMVQIKQPKKNVMPTWTRIVFLLKHMSFMLCCWISYLLFHGWMLYTH